MASSPSPPASTSRLFDLHHQLSFAETFSTSCSVRDESRPPDIGEEDGEASLGASEAISAAERALAFRSRPGVSAAAADRAVGEACDAYQAIKESPDGKAAEEEEGTDAFLRWLASRSVDRAAVASAAKEYSSLSSPDLSGGLEDRLRSALTPEYLWLFQRVGQLPGGVKFLVDLRADLIQAAKRTAAASVEESRTSLQELRSMNTQLRQLLSLWFSVGFLELEQVTWDSPCAMLQKVSDYEAVHPVRNWTDLKARVGAYRRCFVYTHRSMPGEPVVVLHVALKEEVPRAIASVVRHHRMVKRFSVEASSSSSSSSATSPSSSSSPAGEDPSLCKAAIFYSITSTQTGLQGIELGTHLIKQAVRRLKEELPGLVHFSTLSPIPGFR